MGHDATRVLVAIVILLGTFINYRESLPKIHFRGENVRKKEGKETNHTARSHHRPFDGRPRVLLATGCTGSSITITLMRKILIKHYGLQPYRQSKLYRNMTRYKDRRIHSELYKLNKNFLVPVLREKLGPNATDNEVVHESMRMMHAETVKRKRIFLFKLKHQKGATLDFLVNELNARVTTSLRNNAIDRALCNIRDCFQFHGHFGEPVFANNGTRSSLCFMRRHAENVTILANCTVGAWPQAVVGLDNETRTDRLLYQSSNPGHEAQVYEDLYGYTYTPTMRTPDFRLSVDSWMKLMEPLIDRVDRSIIEETLIASGVGTRRPPAPHSQLIYNYDDAVRDLKKTAPTMAEKFLRT